MQPRIGILVVAYNAATTLAAVLDRIPPDFRVASSRSSSATTPARTPPTWSPSATSRSTDLPIKVIRHPRNLGYGGNQKAGYRWAIEHGLDIVVLLHGDGQYAPELLPEMVAPLERGEADAVFGSRMIDKGGARRGGMPMYKFVGNRILTTFENTVAAGRLSEWHSGYRAYSVPALRDVPFDHNHDGFDFDTQVIIQLIEAGKRIVEIPIPTYYGDEICYVNGVEYARDVTRDVAALPPTRWASAPASWPSPATPTSTRGRRPARTTAGRAGCRPAAGRVLDLGCADGWLAAELRGRAPRHRRRHGRPDGVEERVDRFIEADLDQGLPPEVEGPFDVILAADVLEHVRRPEQVLDQLAPCWRPGRGDRLRAELRRTGTRACGSRSAGSTTTRGILDNTHLRFFTRPSFERLVHEHGWAVAHAGLHRAAARGGRAGGADEGDAAVGERPGRTAACARAAPAGRQRGGAGPPHAVRLPAALPAGASTTPDPPVLGSLEPRTRSATGSVGHGVADRAVVEDELDAARVAVGQAGQVGCVADLGEPAAVGDGPGVDSAALVGDLVGLHVAVAVGAEGHHAVEVLR